MQGLVQQCNIHHIRSSPYITAHLVTLYSLVTQTLHASACLYVFFVSWYYLFKL